jgi:hypothetical protein
VVGEDLRAIGAAEHARQIDYAQAGHCAGSGYRTHGQEPSLKEKIEVLS